MTFTIRRNLSMKEAQAIGLSGMKQDVDLLMSFLYAKQELRIIKLIDFAIGLVNNQDGIIQLEYYLFNGNKLQRSYAALYFKRNLRSEILHRAVKKGAIDNKQAYSR